MEHKHTEKCYSSSSGYKEYLIHAAPSYLWADVQDVGSYQGSVYGVAFVDGKIALYEDSYGSCSGCGAWGEGGEPSTEEEIISRTTFTADPLKALEYIAEQWVDSYESPDVEKLRSAIDAIAYTFMDLDYEYRKIIRSFNFVKIKETNK